MRRASLPLLGFVLVLTGLLANIPIGLLSAAWASTVSVRPAWMAALIVGVAVVGLDLAANQKPSTAWLRPIAVQRQVPQRFGHTHGPWRAAARYGFRLGVGPATILNTWTWWGGLALAVTSGPAAVALSVGAFVLTRTSVTIAAGVGPRDGEGMARRGVVIERLRHRALVSSHVVVLVVVVLVVVVVAARP